MPIDAVGGFGGGAALMNRQTFGAQVVSKTLDYLNSSPGSGASLAPVDKQSFGAAVVAKTLDYMNSGSIGNQGGNASYDFQKSVLSAYGTGGALVNTVT